jgi:Fe-S-cluster-containing dehydrogenase component
VFAPITCQHCEKPACVEACPTKACHRDVASDRVVIDKRKCIGCRTCTVACPFGHPVFDEKAGVTVKCDYCDGTPECARVCDRKAIEYVFSDEASGQKRRYEALQREDLGRHPSGRDSGPTVK